MLILARRIGESIRIGDNIEITVLSVNGNQVKIGTNAPKDVEVHRGEVYDKIQEEKGKPPRDVGMKSFKTPTAEGSNHE